MKKYDIALLGPLSLDINVEPNGEEGRELGGAVTYSPYAAAVAGADLIVLPKANLEQVDVQSHYERFNGHLLPIDAEKTTSIRNVYLDASHEKRNSSCIAQTSGFSMSDLGTIEAKIFHLAGLIYGDFQTEFIKELAKHGDLAVDAQCLLRHADLVSGKMYFVDWKDKLEALPLIKYFKVDANEAEIMTGTTDRMAAAKQLHAYGVQEVFISYHEEMMVYDGHTFYVCPYTPTSTIGRTGRGDTVFAAYIAKRLTHNISESLLFATSLVALKIAKMGPFLGTEADVEANIKANAMQVHTFEA